MPKEALMEDLVKRASESRETAAAMEGIGEAEPIWKVTDMDHLKTGKKIQSFSRCAHCAEPFVSAYNKPEML